MIIDTNQHKGVFAPWNWGHKHIKIMFCFLSEMPLANSIYEIARQTEDAFVKAETEFTALTDLEKQGHKQLQSFPSFRSEDRLKGLRMAAAVTTREIFLYGENGALEVRKLGDFESLSDVQFFGTQAILMTKTLCYAKADKNGRDVWGRDMFNPCYLELPDVVSSLRTA